MRVIKSLLYSLVLLLISGTIGFFILREALLQIALSQINSSMSYMRQIAQKSDTYLLECRKKGVLTIDTETISAIQLRFISNHEYVAEVLCSQFTLDPIVVHQRSFLTLPAIAESIPFVSQQLVTKQPGSGGIIWGDELSGVNLELWGRVRGIGVENRSIVSGLILEPRAVLQPITSCDGLGYTCCADESSRGVGEVIDTVTDCPRSCFASCEARPVILSLGTQPFYDGKTRILDINRGESVEIGYVVDPRSPGAVEVTIDYGDGSTDVMSEVQAMTSHVFNCSQESCEFVVSVSARNSMGIESVPTAVTQVTIRVR